MVLMAVSCFATDYTNELILAGESQGQKTISVDKQNDGKYQIVLKNFSYGSMNLGDIKLTNVEAKDDEYGNTELTTTGQEVTVKVLFLPVTVTVDLKGKIVGDKFYADITIHNIPHYGTWEATFAGGLKKAPTTGISNLPINTNEKVELYNLQGQRISEAKPGQMVIEKKGGKAVKVVK